MTASEFMAIEMDERLFKSLDAVAKAQKIMQPVATIKQFAPGAKA